MRTVYVTVPGRAPTPNARPGVTSFGWALIAKWREAARAAASGALQAEGRTMLTYEVDVAGKKAKRPKLVTRRRDPRPMLYVERLEVTVIVPDRRDRDWDNAIASTKPLIDGFVEAGVMVGDSTRHINSAGRSLVFRHEAGQSRTEFVIVEGQAPGTLELE